MALYLVQHGKNLLEAVDPDKGLSEEGRADVERIAQVAKGYGVPVALIRHSGKKRARQTAEIFARALNPPHGFEAGPGLNPLDDVAALAPSLNPEDNLMLVGHLPFMERLTTLLATGATGPPIFRFQNGGIVCLDRDPGQATWFIKWTLMPRIG